MLACLLVFYRSGAAPAHRVARGRPALALTLATLGLLHEPLNLFHVLSLLLVLGLGVDYAIILREGRSHQAVLAVFLSMTTTLISFGLLGFSSVPFVRSIGITVALWRRVHLPDRDCARRQADRISPPDAQTRFLLLHRCSSRRARTRRAPQRADSTPRALARSRRRPRSASQVIHAVYGARAVTLRTAIQVDAAGLKVVGVTATGQRLFTVSYDGTAVTADKSAVRAREARSRARARRHATRAVAAARRVQTAFRSAGTRSHRAVRGCTATHARRPADRRGALRERRPLERAASGS